MSSFDVGPGGLTFDGHSVRLPCSAVELTARFGKAGSVERLQYGVRHHFPKLGLVALESLHPADPGAPIDQLELNPEAAPGPVTVEGVPWREVRFRSTKYGKEKRVGGWIVSASEEEWTLYPDPDAKKASVKREGSTAKTSAVKKVAAAKAPAKARREREGPTYPEVATKDVVPFVDRNFKLMVIEHLMFEKKVLKPAFVLEDFVAAWKKRAIDLDSEGYDAPIPEVLAWFEKYPVDRRHVAQVRKLMQHPGSVIHGIYPQWTGEDDTFVIQKADDASSFPALKEVVFFSKSPRHDARLVKAFAAYGITART